MFPVFLFIGNICVTTQFISRKKMALTRNFIDTISKRAARETSFRHSLFRESLELMLSGELNTGKSILRSYINATVGFEELGKILEKSSKSLMRMFSPSGNPTASNLFSIIQTLREREGVTFEVHTVHYKGERPEMREHA